MAAILFLAAAHERIPGTCSIPDNLHATEMGEAVQWREENES